MPLSFLWPTTGSNLDPAEGTLLVVEVPLLLMVEVDLLVGAAVVLVGSLDVYLVVELGELVVTRGIWVVSGGWLNMRQPPDDTCCCCCCLLDTDTGLKDVEAAGVLYLSFELLVVLCASFTDSGACTFCW